MLLGLSHFLSLEAINGKKNFISMIAKVNFTQD